MKILVIDNDVQLVFDLKHFLKKEKFSFDYSFDADEGFAMVINNKYDLIIMDINLQKMNGIDLCMNIRSASIFTPIIFLTKTNDISFKIKAFSCGCDDYILKPFNIKELVLRMKAILRRPKIIEENILKIEDLEVDINRHIVKRGEENIQLTNKEFLLLEYLVKNNGNFSKRDEIFDNVWDSNANPFNNIVEVYINRLRKKIDDNYSLPLINNSVGVGYYIGRKKIA